MPYIYWGHIRIGITRVELQKGNYYPKDNYEKYMHEFFSQILSPLHIFLKFSDRTKCKCRIYFSVQYKQDHWIFAYVLKQNPNKITNSQNTK